MQVHIYWGSFSWAQGDCMVGKFTRHQEEEENGNVIPIIGTFLNQFSPNI